MGCNLYKSPRGKGIRCREEERGKEEGTEGRIGVGGVEQGELYNANMVKKEGVGDQEGRPLWSLCLPSQVGEWS